MPCTLGKVCNWDTVNDSAQSHKSKNGTENTKASAETNSDEFGRHGECSDSVQHVNVETMNKKKEKCGKLMSSSVPSSLTTDNLLWSSGW